MRCRQGRSSLLPLLLLVVAAPAQEEQETASRLAVVKGRCVAAETGEPLAGCRVEFEGWPCNDELMSLHGKPDWTDPKPVITGADGRFEFRFVPPPPYQHHLDISAPGRVPRTARWGPFEPGQVDDLGDVPLSVGYTLQGRVIDEHGKPVARLSVGFFDLPLPIRDDAANDTRYGRTDENGRFTVSSPMPPGSWPIIVGGRGFELIEPDRVVVVARKEPSTVTIHVARVPAISGVVFDDRSRPVQGVCLQARPGAGNWMTSAWTRRDGSFTIFKRHGSPDEVTLEIVDPGPCEIVPIEGVYTWGTHGLRIELPRALSFQLTVVEQGTGRPVEHYAVICHKVRKGFDSRFMDPRLGEGTHANGVVVVDKVWRGRNRLQVLPRDPSLGVSEVIEFDATEETLGPRRIEVPRLQATKAILVDGQGRPLANCRVWVVLDRSRGRWRLRRGMFDDPRGSRRIHTSSPIPVPVAQSGSRTAADGSVTLHWARADGKLAIVAQRDGKWLVHEGFEPQTVREGSSIVVK